MKHVDKLLVDFIVFFNIYYVVNAFQLTFHSLLILSFLYFLKHFSIQFLPNIRVYKWNTGRLYFQPPSLRTSMHIFSILLFGLRSVCYYTFFQMMHHSSVKHSRRIPIMQTMNSFNISSIENMYFILFLC